MDGGSGKRDRAKYDIYMEATMLARIEDANAAFSAQLCSMSAEVESQKEKHEQLVKHFSVRPPSQPHMQAAGPGLLLTSTCSSCKTSVSACAGSRPRIAANKHLQKLQTEQH